MEKTISVITADIVASGNLHPRIREDLFMQVKKALEELKEEEWLATYELFRGDSFQCVPSKKEQALRVALIIKAFMKAYQSPEDKEKYQTYPGKGKMATKGYFPGKNDVRLSIGIGGVDFYKEKDLAHSDGQAFWFSGQGLDQLKSVPYRISLKIADEQVNESLEPAIMLLDAVMQKWTNNQAEAVMYKLKDWTEEEISRKVGVTQPAVNQRLKTAQWYAIEKLLMYFEKIVNEK